MLLIIPVSASIRDHLHSMNTFVVLNEHFDVSHDRRKFNICI